MWLLPILISVAKIKTLSLNNLLEIASEYAVVSEECRIQQ